MDPAYNTHSDGFSMPDDSVHDMDVEEQGDGDYLAQAPTKKAAARAPRRKVGLSLCRLLA